MASTLLSGVAFGAALTASGVHHPAVILGQLKLANWDMMETFLTATATSTLVVSAFRATDALELPPRSYSPLGLFAHYDGNIIGGALLGTGMALAASCPGTVLAQIGAGLSTGVPALAGAIAAGIAWTGLIRPWLRSTKRYRPCPPPAKAPTHALHESLGLNQHATAVAFEAALAIAVAALVTLSGNDIATGGARAMRPVVGGLLIGAAQLLSLVLRRSALGVSTAYEEAGDFFWWLLDWTPAPDAPARPGRAAVTFATGVTAGAWAVTRAGLPAILAFEAPVAAIPMWQSALGGFVMVLGARIAGGCTSGHGISGMSLLSVSSFLTIGSALAAGIFTAKMFL